MEEDQARAALAEVERRRGEATRIAARQSLPRWYAAVAVVVLLALTVWTDLDSLYPDRTAWLPGWAVSAAGLVVLLVCALVLSWRSRIAAHRPVRSGWATAAVVWAVVWYGFTLAVGMPMRSAGIPFDQTVSVVAGILLALAVWAGWRRYRDHRG